LVINREGILIEQIHSIVVKYYKNKTLH